MSASSNVSCSEAEERFYKLKLSIFRGPYILYAIGMICSCLFFGAEKLRSLYVKLRVDQRIQRFMGAAI